MKRASTASKDTISICLLVSGYGAVVVYCCAGRVCRDTSVSTAVPDCKYVAAHGWLVVVSDGGDRRGMRSR